MKKTVSVLLSLFIITGSVIFASGAADSPKLYNTYADGMVFEHDKPITVAGVANKDSKITFKIIDSNNEIIRRGSSTAADDGSFEAVCDSGINAGYDSYKIKVYADGELFAELSDILFGAVWMASGQSNMQMSLKDSATGSQMKENGETGSKYVRYLSVPALPEYKGNSALSPLKPQNDIAGCEWIYGDTSEIYSISAVGYYFGQRLHEELDMPVGIICNALGGSSIYSWLSREAVENDSTVLNESAAVGAYVSKSDWSTDTVNLYSTITTNYNKKIYAMRFFNLDGMIWYQGESNAMNEYGYYTHAFNLLQKSYSELFGYEDSSLPIVYSEIADYHYSDSIPYIASMMNMQMSEIQKENPRSRAQVTVYDVNTSHGAALGVIHPIHKYEIAQKLVYAAAGLVYEKHDTYTAPVMKHVRIDGSDVYVSFANVGDGLMVKKVTPGEKKMLYGFSVCGADGNYVAANAEIVDECTVKVNSVFVENPEAVSYAYTENNFYANLFSSDDGEPLYGASPFITYLPVTTHFNDFKDWMDCDLIATYRYGGESLSGYYYTWNVDSGDASLDYDYQNPKHGSAALKITHKSDKFTVAPKLTYENDGKYCVFGDEDNNYSDFRYIGVWLKNTSPYAVSLDKIKFYISKNTYYSPVAAGADGCSVSIPADGQWHVAVFDLNNVCFDGSSILKNDNSVIDKVYDIKFCFEASAQGQLYMDYIFLVPETSPVQNVYHQKYIVAYEGNRGTAVPETVKTAADSDCVISHAIPERDGYEFSEWNTLADGSGTSYLPGQTFTGRKDLILYAIWKTEDFVIKDESISCDFENGFISGFDIDSLSEESIMSVFENDNIEVISDNGKYSTGTLINLKEKSGRLCKTLTVVIFGDLNSDGKCDAMDAVIAHSIKTGFLAKSDAGAAVCRAADCNRDGCINGADVELLENSGLMAAVIPQ